MLIYSKFICYVGVDLEDCQLFDFLISGYYSVIDSVLFYYSINSEW